MVRGRAKFPDVGLEIPLFLKIERDAFLARSAEPKKQLRKQLDFLDLHKNLQELLDRYLPSRRGRDI